MYKEKLKDYESPTIDVLYLKFEGVVCQSTGGIKGLGDGDVIDDTDLWS